MDIKKKGRPLGGPFVLQHMSAQTRSITMAMPWPTPMHMVQSA